jgi:hypothetical protein
MALPVCHGMDIPVYNPVFRYIDLPQIGPNHTTNNPRPVNEPDLLWALCSSAENYESVETLLNTHTDLDLDRRTGRFYETALHICIRKMPRANTRFTEVANRQMIVQLLLDRGADPLALNHEGETPLHYTMMYAHGPVILLSMLEIYPDLELNIRNKWGRTALFESVQRQPLHITMILMQHGAKPYIPSSDGKTVLHNTLDSPYAEQLIAYGADVYAHPLHQRTPLHAALVDFQYIPVTCTGRLRYSNDWILTLQRLQKNVVLTDEADIEYAERVEKMFWEHCWEYDSEGRTLAFGMAQHQRLGEHSRVSELPDDTLRMIQALCE